MEEKVKLISLNEKQWHYRLIKYVFPRIEPKQLQNLCPYFWLMVASLFLVIPVTPFKLIGLFFKSIYRTTIAGIAKWKSSKMNEWLNKLTVLEAYDLWALDSYSNEIIKRPSVSEKYYDSYLLDKWAKNHGLDPNDPEYRNKLAEMFKKIKQEHADLVKKRSKEMEEYKKRLELRARRKAERDKKIKAKLDKIGSALNFIPRSIESTKNAFKINNVGAIVKATKRFIGLLVTVILAAIIAFISQFVSYAVLALADIWSWAAIGDFFWTILVWTPAVIAGAGIVVGIVALIIRAVTMYEKNKTIAWYAIPFVYLALFIFNVCKYVIYYPCYAIFYQFLGRLIFESIIWGTIKGLGIAFFKFGGIFAQYFGASYTDYCPGVDWGDSSHNKN